MNQTQAVKVPFAYTHIILSLFANPYHLLYAADTHFFSQFISFLLLHEFLKIHFLHAYISISLCEKNLMGVSYAIHFYYVMYIDTW